MAKAIARYPGMPILGVLPAMAKDPLKLIRQMTLRYNDMVSAQMFNRQYVFVNDPNLVHKILVTNTNDFRKSDRSINLISRAFGKGLLGNQANDTHKTQRKLIQPAFHKQKIRGYADMMTDYSRTFVAQWQDGEIMDVSRAMNSLTMYIVAKALFGANMSDVEGDAYEAAQAIDVLQQETIRLTTSLWLWPKWMPTPSNRRLAKARSVIDRTLAKLIAQRRERGDLAEADGPNDFLAMLLAAEYDDGSKMEDGQIKDELATMFFAGHETTANSLTWTFYLLAQNPEARARLHQELDTVLQGRPATLDDLPSLPYTEMVVKESLRLYPPAWVVTPRQANSDMTLGDYAISKDQMLFISIYGLHRNATYFPEPERFDPERFNEEREKQIPRYAYMPFGAGPRVCIGNVFAMMEARLILANVAQQFNLDLAKDASVELSPQITLSARHGMPMRVSAR